MPQIVIDIDSARGPIEGHAGHSHQGAGCLAQGEQAVSC